MRRRNVIEPIQTRVTWTVVTGPSLLVNGIAVILIWRRIQGRFRRACSQALVTTVARYCISCTQWMENSFSSNNAVPFSRQPWRNFHNHHCRHRTYLSLDQISALSQQCWHHRFFTIVHDHTTRAHSLKLFVPSSRVNCRQHFFRCACYWCAELTTWRRRLSTTIIVVCKSSKMRLS